MFKFNTKAMGQLLPRCSLAMDSVCNKNDCKPGKIIRAEYETPYGATTCYIAQTRFYRIWGDAMATWIRRYHITSRENTSRMDRRRYQSIVMGTPSIANALAFRLQDVCRAQDVSRKRNA